MSSGTLTTKVSLSLRSQCYRKLARSTLPKVDVIVVALHFELWSSNLELAQIQQLLTHSCDNKKRRKKNTVAQIDDLLEVCCSQTWPCSPCSRPFTTHALVKPRGDVLSEKLSRFAGINSLPGVLGDGSVLPRQLVAAPFLHPEALSSCAAARLAQPLPQTLQSQQHSSNLLCWFLEHYP